MRAQPTFQNEVEMWDARQHLLAGINYNNSWNLSTVSNGPNGLLRSLKSRSPRAPWNFPGRGGTARTWRRGRKAVWLFLYVPSRQSYRRGALIYSISIWTFLLVEKTRKTNEDKRNRRTVLAHDSEVHCLGIWQPTLLHDSGRSQSDDTTIKILMIKLLLHCKL